MGKKNKDVGSLFRQQQKEIEELERVAQKRRRALAASCNHRKGDRLTIEFGKKGKARCKQCNSHFIVSTFDLTTVEDAANVLNSVLQQVRLVANPKHDEKRITELGKLSADIKSVPEIYKRHLEKYKRGGFDNNKNNKDKDRNRNEYGGYDGIVALMSDVMPKKQKKRNRR